jgi:serine phosphatase RsbU (regulator of sigma subunit)
MLDAAENAAPVEAVETVTRELGHDLDASRISFLITDVSGRALVRLAHVSPHADTHADTDGDTDGERAVRSGGREDARERAAVLPFDGGPAEQVVRSQRVQVLSPEPGVTDGQWTVLAPVTERGESLGLLELVVPTQPTAADLDEIRHAAHLLAFVVIANRRHTDLYEWGQRTQPFTLSAEIQRRLLPAAFTCEAAAFTLSGWLEPAASVGGDTFDYSLARDALHLSMTDAMGHGVASALTATLCVGALRAARRRGASLEQQVQESNAALVEHAQAAGSEAFATGLLGRVDLRTGRLSLVNAGHVAPYLVRDGRVTTLDLPPGLPLGLFAEARYAVTTHALVPGDRLVLVTDGMVERIAADFALPAGIAATRSLHPREAVRLLADHVLEATGHALADDATLLVVDWHGGDSGRRVTTAGSEPSRTSPALG